MATFQVLRPIEKDGQLFLPPQPGAPAKARSACNGAVIPVDAGGVIELTAAEAQEMTAAQVAPVAVKKKK